MELGAAGGDFGVANGGGASGVHGGKRNSGPWELGAMAIGGCRGNFAADGM
jgi:hypothetical protein